MTLERFYCEYSDECRHGFIAHLFGLTTYDSDLDEILVDRCLDVCHAITTGTTFSYIDLSHDEYLWYVTILNLPFFRERVEWGTSIRGAWWRPKQPCVSDGNFEITFKSVSDWVSFLEEIRQFLDESKEENE